MSDAFSGLKLSSPTPGEVNTPVEQRLFAPRAPQAAATPLQAPAMPSTPAGKEAGKEGKRETRKLPAGINSGRGASAFPDRALAPFDINESPWTKGSFLFTDGEFERLEDMKLALRRRFDLRATKNDIVRAALHNLYEDYTREPARSIIVRAMRRKKA